MLSIVLQWWNSVTLTLLPRRAHTRAIVAPIHPWMRLFRHLSRRPRPLRRGDLLLCQPGIASQLLRSTTVQGWLISALTSRCRICVRSLAGSATAKLPMNRHHRHPQCPRVTHRMICPQLPPQPLQQKKYPPPSLRQQRHRPR